MKGIKTCEEQSSCYFNWFLTISLIFIAAGFFFFKDSFTANQNLKSNSNNPEILMDMMNYLDYSEGNLKLAQAHGRTVLFFAATLWCQTCSQLDKEIKERSGSLPPDVTILKVDYDNDKATKAKYGVTTQHTLIQIDSDGNEIKRWIGGNFDALVQNLN